MGVLNRDPDWDSPHRPFHRKELQDLVVKAIKNRGHSKCYYINELADWLFDEYGQEYEEWT